MSQNRLQALLSNKAQLDQLPLNVKAKIFELVEELEERKSAEQAQKSFMAFVRKVWPAFINGAHHVKMAEAFVEALLPFWMGLTFAILHLQGDVRNS